MYLIIIHPKPKNPKLCNKPSHQFALKASFFLYTLHISAVNGHHQVIY